MHDSNNTEELMTGLVGDSFLCVAYGESERPCALLARNREAVQEFIVSHWMGDPDDEQLPLIMIYFDQHDWRRGPLTWEFEIGGIQINDVFDVTPKKYQSDIQGAAGGLTQMA